MTDAVPPLTLVLLAADPLARQGLAGLLTTAGALVHALATAGDAHALVEAEAVDAVVVDGAELLAALALDVPVVALVDGAEAAAMAVRDGAWGVVHRGVEASRVMAAARAVALGLRVVDDRYPDLLRLPDLEPPDDPLTPREEEVLLRLAEGWSNARIATDLGVSERTVKFHVNQLMLKLGATTRTDAVVRAARSGLLWL
ncbi:MAG: response regulator transcription factor [Alphaproteobacteria bacterium]|nr:response regulator transcription factor [Alphaproteobacteria bacterium]